MDLISIILLIFAIIFLLFGVVYFWNKESFKNLADVITDHSELCLLIGFLEIVFGIIVVVNAFEWQLHSAVAAILGALTALEGFVFLAFRKNIIALTHKTLEKPKIVLWGAVFSLALSAFLFALVFWI